MGNLNTKSPPVEQRILVCGVEQGLAYGINDLIARNGNAKELGRFRKYSPMGLGARDIDGVPNAKVFTVSGGSQIYPLWRSVILPKAPTEQGTLTSRKEHNLAGLIYIFPGTRSRSSFGSGRVQTDMQAQNEQKQKGNYEEALMNNPVKYLKYLIGEAVDETGYCVILDSDPAEVATKVAKMPVFVLVELTSLQEDMQATEKEAEGEARRIANENSLGEILSKSGRPWKIGALQLLEGEGCDNSAADKAISNALSWIQNTNKATA
ncbi:unnamed protein product [Amoebophrya sp. A25]|nr:unnamed protein product [Amoebophrya sp. A25]|eukprot:GSA25T00016558001.1